MLNGSASSEAAEAAEAWPVSLPSLFDTIPMVVMSGTVGAAVDGRAAVEAEDAAAEEVEADAIVSATRSEGWAVVAREAAVDAAAEAGRGGAGASRVGRAAEMALRFLRGCLTSEGTGARGRAEGWGWEAAAAGGGVDAGTDDAKAWAGATGWVYMLRLATEVQGCRGMGMSIGTRRYSCAAIWSSVGRWLGSGWRMRRMRSLAASGMNILSGKV